MKLIRTAICGALAALMGVACAPKPAAQNPAPVTVAGRPDPAQERRIAVLHLKLLERDGVAEDMQGRLDDAMREVVRAMAKLQSLATRAEAVSAMAEAEVSTRQLRTGGAQGAADAARAQRLMELSNAEFQQQNYAGAVYLANQAKSVANAGGGRLSIRAGQLKPGEIAFAVQLNLAASGRSKVREGPGTSFRVAFSVDAGTHLTAQSYLDAWVRVQDDGGRTGWIYSTALRSVKK